MKRYTTPKATLTWRILVAAGVLLATAPGVNGQQENSPLPERTQPASSLSSALSTQNQSSRNLNDGSPLGTNLSQVSDWATEWPFINAFKSSRTWMTFCEPSTQDDCKTSWDTGESAVLDLDKHGWIKTLPKPEAPQIFTSAGTLLFRGLGGNYPAGEYLVLYEGEGTLRYGFDARKLTEKSQPGRETIEVDPTNAGIFLGIAETDPKGSGDYLRNIRVVPPGLEAEALGSTFHPDFIESLKSYKVIRFMNWMRANGSSQEQWRDRPEVDDVRYSTEAGVPVEVMVDLVNQLKADPWFTVPHRASSNYVEEFAMLVHDRLLPDSKVYLEYSNEVWNSAFPQGRWVEEQGVRAWPDSSISGFTKRINWYGERSADVCSRWKRIWEEDADRVICVMASQSANSWTAEEALKCRLSSSSPCYEKGIGALAIAPYFGHYLGNPSAEETVKNWTFDGDGGLGKLFVELEQGGQLPDGPDGGALRVAVAEIQRNKAVADEFELPLLAYEGGQHLVGIMGVENNPVVTKLLTAANRDRRMGQVYHKYLDAWKDAGGQMFVHFLNTESYTKWGSWGAREDMSNQDTPKFKEIQRFIQKNPCWWRDCASSRVQRPR